MPKALVAAAAALATLVACTPEPFGRGAGPLDAGDRIAAHRAALARDPNDVRALAGIGDAHFARADWGQAAGAYREALLVAPGDRDVMLRFGAAQAGQRDYASAVRMGRQALAARSDVAALVTTAVGLNGMRRHAEARALLEQAAALAPRDLDVRNNLALTLALMGDASGYGVQRGVAFAPDADVRHRRNFFVVAGLLGLGPAARADGAALDVPASVIDAALAIGRDARARGVDAFGLTIAG